MAVNLINSIYNDKRDIHTVNVLNQGAISDLNADEVVEVNSIITKHGPIPLATGSLPLPIRGIIQQIKAFELMVIEAAIEKDYDKVLLALVTNPLSRDDHRSEAIINELAEAHKNICLIKGKMTLGKIIFTCIIARYMNLPVRI